jgi:rSAM-associated Gly-rich repeat protein
MANRRRQSRTQKVLSILLPVGVLGVSAALASARAAPSETTEPDAASRDTLKNGVAARLQAIRSSVSGLDADASSDANGDPKIVLAQWVNVGGGGVGWRNGGWGNAGGWRNGGWGNAGPWRNGGWSNAGPWRNGGWGNGGWRNAPWGNGWRNFWQNW